MDQHHAAHRRFFFLPSGGMLQTPSPKIYHKMKDEGSPNNNTDATSNTPSTNLGSFLSDTLELQSHDPEAVLHQITTVEEEEGGSSSGQESSDAYVDESSSSSSPKQQQQQQPEVSTPVYTAKERFLHYFFRSVVPTPDIRRKNQTQEGPFQIKDNGNEDDDKLKFPGLKTPATNLGSFLSDTVQLQTEDPEASPVVLNNVTGHAGDFASSRKVVQGGVDHIDTVDGNLDQLDSIRRGWRRACCLRSTIAGMILFAGLIVLTVVLIPLLMNNLSQDSKLQDHTDKVQNTLLSAEVPTGPILISAPAPSPTTDDTRTSNLKAPTPAPVDTFYLTRPTSSAGAPVDRPSSTPPGPLEPTWTASVQTEDFWTSIENLEVPIELPWKRIADGRLQIEIINSLDLVYDEYLQTSIGDWNASSFLDLRVRNTSPNHEGATCRPEVGTIKLCSTIDEKEDDGDWYGQLFLKGRFISAATVQIRSSHVPLLDTDKIQYELCHVLGHSLGLNHADHGGCMVDDENDAGDFFRGFDNHKHPDSESLFHLESFYGGDSM